MVLTVAPRVVHELVIAAQSGRRRPIRSVEYAFRCGEGFGANMRWSAEELAAGLRLD